MWRVILSRLGGAIAALFVLSLVAFSMVRLLPGNISDALLGVEGSIEARQAIIARYGLDKPLPLQYLKWLGNALHGDLGLTATQRPVLDAISSRIQPSVSLALVGIAMSVIISLTLGTLAGLRRNTVVDRVVTGLAVVASSVPDFVIGLVLILLVARNFSVLPTFGYVPINRGFGDWLLHLLLPGFALSALLTGLLTRLTRTSVAEVLAQEHVRTARGKGLSNARVLFAHVLRPSLIPVVTAAGLYLVAAIPSVVVIEVVFAIPGVGRLIVDSIANRDFASIQGATLLIGAMAIVVTFLVDLSYRLIDPRTRRS